MQEIAAACRLTKAGLYHHIQNKEQLLLAIMDYGMDLFEEQVLAQVQDIVDPVERLRACMRQQHRAGDARAAARRSSSSSTSTPRSRARRASTSTRARSSTCASSRSPSRRRSTQGRIRAVRAHRRGVLVPRAWCCGFTSGSSRTGGSPDEQIADGMVDLFFAGLVSPQPPCPARRACRVAP